MVFMPIVTIKPLVIRAGVYRLMNSLRIYILKVNRRTAGIFREEITANECFEALKSFEKNKTPGNDGLTVEFYLGFWHLVERCLVNALNFAH